MSTWSLFLLVLLFWSELLLVSVSKSMEARGAGLVVRLLLRRSSFCLCVLNSSSKSASWFLNPPPPPSSYSLFCLSNSSLVTSLGNVTPHKRRRSLARKSWNIPSWKHLSTGSRQWSSHTAICSLLKPLKWWLSMHREAWKAMRLSCEGVRVCI